ncbi:hypothetical protein O6R08_04210 [Cutibacterium equinum]|uniref:Uncharacterized protein n=1 Tax=Cutibacterium equinum TaxID=3016342 RepID=A0ABY7R071_9ACTN|nr:hypothetical protein [Cutibacterium equinum]WCC80694.1 hypothetical protein O6R08_04210 [Cutibacterium equinum]
MKKLITAALAALTITSFSIAAPAQAAPTSASLQHRVSTQTGTQTQGLMFAFCDYYPSWCD